MTKTLKNFLEVYKPKSPDEQKFVDKHVTIKHSDRNGNGDDVFKGNTKTIKRKEERHGYDAGEDEKVYEETEIEESLGYGYKASSEKSKFDAGHRAHLLNPEGKTSYLSAKSYKTAKHAKDAAKYYHSIGHLSVRTIDNKMHDYNKAYDAKHGKNESVEIDLETLLDEALDLLVSIDEKTLTPAEMKKREEVVKAIKKGNPKMDKSMAYAIATKTAKRVAEEAEELDEISVKKLTDYAAKASDARGHRNMPAEKLDKRYKSMALAHEKIRARHAKVAAEGYVPTADEPTEADKKTAQKVRDMLAKEKKPVKEEAQIDELSRATIGRYSLKAKSIADNEGGKDRTKGRELAGRKRWGGSMSGVEKAKVMATEESEQIDELSKKTLGSYVSKASKSATGLMAGAAAIGATGGSAHGKEMGRTAVKRLKGIDKAVNKLTKEDIINRTIEKYVPEDIKFTPEERLLKRLDGLSESHVNTLLGLFEALNSENQNKMIETVETREGINSLLNFALENRGE
jgi:hypothetical protein